MIIAPGKVIQPLATPFTTVGSQCQQTRCFRVVAFHDFKGFPNQFHRGFRLIRSKCTDKKDLFLPFCKPEYLQATDIQPGMFNTLFNNFIIYPEMF